MNTDPKAPDFDIDAYVTEIQNTWARLITPDSIHKLLANESLKSFEVWDVGFMPRTPPWRVIAEKYAELSTRVQVALNTAAEWDEEAEREIVEAEGYERDPLKTHYNSRAACKQQCAHELRAVLRHP